MFWLLGLLGSGISALGQSQSAAAMQEAAELNHELESENALVKRDMGLASLRARRAGQRIGYQSASMNLHMDALATAAKRRNAQRIREFVEYNTRKDREGIGRQAGQFDRLQSSQQAAVGASGITFEGAPMEVVADSFEQMSFTLADMHDEMNYRRASGLQDSVNLDHEAGWETYLNRFNRRQFRRTRKIEGFANWLEKTSVRQQFRADMMQAEVNLLHARAQAQAQQSAALGSLVSSVGSAIGQLGGGSTAIPSFS